MDERPRLTFGVRRMLGIVAVAAFLCAVVLLWGRLAYRRARIDAILRDQVHGYNPGRGFLSEPTPLFVALKEARPADYARLRADPEAVVRRLLLTIEVGGEAAREPGPQFRMAPGSAALILLREWLDEVDSVALARSARDRLLTRLLDGAIQTDSEMEAVGLVTTLTQRLGPDQVPRAAIRERVRSLVGREERRWILYSWASLAGAIGGREEMDLLLDLARGPDDATFQAASGSGLRATRWPGVFPALARLSAPPPRWRAGFGLALRAWNATAVALGTPTWEIDWLIWANDGPNPTLGQKDPWSAWQRGSTVWTGLVRKALPLATRARPDRFALGMPIMLTTPRGRAFLLAYAEDAKNPPQLRRKAVHMLKRNREGIRLLLDVCEDPARRATVARFFGRDNTNLVSGGTWDMIDANYWPVDSHFKAANASDPSDPRPELRMILAYRSDGASLPLGRYVDDLDVGTESQVLLRRGVPASEVDAVARARAARARRMLETLVPPPHPETRDGWAARLKSVDGPTPWDVYLDALARHPDAPIPGYRLGYTQHPDALAFYLPYQITLPPGTEPAMIRLARDHPESYGAEPLKALLIYGGRWQEAEGIFDLMESILRRTPDRLSARDPDLLRALVCRFAVNRGWDVDAWRSWWRREGRAEAEAESTAGRTSP
jgi:hypothetical protein